MVGNYYMDSVQRCSSTVGSCVVVTQGREFGISMAPYLGNMVPKRKSKSVDHASKKLCLDENVQNNDFQEEWDIKSLCEEHSVELHSKLQRLDKLVSSLLIALRNAAREGEADSLPTELPKGWCNAFKKHMTALSSPQVIRMFKSLLWSLDEDCVKPLEANPLDSNCLKLLPLVSQLLSTFSSKVHMAEHIVPGSIVAKFISQMDELHQILGRFGCGLLNKEHDHILMSSFLTTCLSWGNMQVLMLHYRRQDEAVVCTGTLVDSSATNLSGFHSYLTGDQWNLIAQRITNFGDLSCKSLLNQLVLQKFEVIILWKGDSNGTLANAAVKFLASTLDKEWPQLLQNNGLLLPSHLNCTSLIEVVHHVVRDLATNDTNVPELLGKPGIQESLPLVSALVIVTLLQVSKTWTSTRKNISLSPCSKMMKDLINFLDPQQVVDSAHGSVDVSQAITGMSECVNECLKTVLDTTLAKETHKLDIKVMRQYFDILKVLPLEFLSQELQFIAIFPLIAVAICLEMTQIEDDDQEKGLKQTIIQIILRILESRTSPNIILYLHAGYFSHWLLEANLQLTPDQYKHMLHLVFTRILRHPSSMNILKSGIPLLQKEMPEMELSLKHMIAADVLLKTFKETSLKIEKLQFSEKDKKQYHKLQKRLTKNIIKCLWFSSKTSHDQSSCAPTKMIYVALQDYIEKKKESKLELITSLLKSTLPSALVGVSEGDQDSMELLGILLKNHSHFSHILPSDFFLQLCNVLMKANSALELQRLLLRNANAQQFKNITQELLKSIIIPTFESPSETSSSIETLPTIWISLVTADFVGLKSQIRQNSLIQLYTILMTAIHVGSFKNADTLLKLNLAVVQSEQVTLKPEIMDCCLESITALEMKNLSSVILALKLLHALLNHCTAQMLDMIPSFVQRYTLLVTIVAREGSQKPGAKDAVCDELIETCGLSIEKLASAMIKHDKQFHRIAQYIVASILHQFEVHILQANIKLHLKNVVFHFFSICDSHAVSYLGHELPPASREIFKTFYREYQQYHRFTGRV